MEVEGQADVKDPEAEAGAEAEAEAEADDDKNEEKEDTGLAEGEPEEACVMEPQAVPVKTHDPPVAHTEDSVTKQAVFQKKKKKDVNLEKEESGLVAADGASKSADAPSKPSGRPIVETIFPDQENEKVIAATPEPEEADHPTRLSPAGDQPEDMDVDATVVDAEHAVNNDDNEAADAEKDDKPASASPATADPVIVYDNEDDDSPPRVQTLADIELDGEFSPEFAFDNEFVAVKIHRKQIADKTANRVVYVRGESVVVGPFTAIQINALNGRRSYLDAAGARGYISHSGPALVDTKNSLSENRFWLRYRRLGAADSDQPCGKRAPITYFRRKEHMAVYGRKLVDVNVAVGNQDVRTLADFLVSKDNDAILPKTFLGKCAPEIIYAEVLLWEMRASLTGADNIIVCASRQIAAVVGSRSIQTKPKGGADSRKLLELCGDPLFFFQSMLNQKSGKARQTILRAFHPHYLAVAARIDDLCARITAGEEEDLRQAMFPGSTPKKRAHYLGVAARLLRLYGNKPAAAVVIFDFKTPRQTVDDTLDDAELDNSPPPSPRRVDKKDENEDGKDADEAPGKKVPDADSDVMIIEPKANASRSSSVAAASAAPKQTNKFRTVSFQPVLDKMFKDDDEDDDDEDDEDFVLRKKNKNKTKTKASREKGDGEDEDEAEEEEEEDDDSSSDAVDLESDDSVDRKTAKKGSVSAKKTENKNQKTTANGAKPASSTTKSPTKTKTDTAAPVKSGKIDAYFRPGEPSTDMAFYTIWSEKSCAPDVRICRLCDVKIAAVRDGDDIDDPETFVSVTVTPSDGTGMPSIDMCRRKNFKLTPIGSATPEASTRAARAVSPVRRAVKRKREDVDDGGDGEAGAADEKGDGDDKGNEDGDDDDDGDSKPSPKKKQKKTAAAGSERGRKSIKDRVDRNMELQETWRKEAKNERFGRRKWFNSLNPCVTVNGFLTNRLIRHMQLSIRMGDPTQAWACVCELIDIHELSPATLNIPTQMIFALLRSAAEDIGPANPPVVHMALDFLNDLNEGRGNDSHPEYQEQELDNGVRIHRQERFDEVGMAQLYCVVSAMAKSIKTRIVVETFDAWAWPPFYESVLGDDHPFPQMEEWRSLAVENNPFERDDKDFIEITRENLTGGRLPLAIAAVQLFAMCIVCNEGDRAERTVESVAPVSVRGTVRADCRQSWEAMWAMLAEEAERMSGEQAAKWLAKNKSGHAPYTHLPGLIAVLRRTFFSCGKDYVCFLVMALHLIGDKNFRSVILAPKVVTVDDEAMEAARAAINHQQWPSIEVTELGEIDFTKSLAARKKVIDGGHFQLVNVPNYFKNTEAFTLASRVYKCCDGRRKMIREPWKIKQVKPKAKSASSKSATGKSGKGKTKN